MNKYKSFEEWLKTENEHTEWPTSMREHSWGYKAWRARDAEIEDLNKRINKLLSYFRECSPTCNAEGHSEDCEAFNPVVSYTKIKEENDRLKAQNEKMINCLERFAIVGSSIAEKILKELGL